jgi:hypothetical protein
MIDRDARAALSLIMTRQHAIKKQHPDTKGARIMAANEVGASLCPPMSGADLLSACFHAMWNGKKTEVYKPKTEQETEMKATRKNDLHSGLSCNEIYETFCKTNDFVPKDATLSAFTGRDKTLFSHARVLLSRNGFCFESVSNGWVVKARPEQAMQSEKLFTESQVRFMIDDLMKKIGKT